MTQATREYEILSICRGTITMTSLKHVSMPRKLTPTCIHIMIKLLKLTNLMNAVLCKVLTLLAGNSRRDVMLTTFIVLVALGMEPITATVGLLREGFI